MGPRLRELAPAAIENKEAGFTQPRDHLLADPCRSITKRYPLYRICLPLQMAMNAYVFVIFIVIQIIFIVYIKVVVPETKNRPIEEITALFK